MTAKILHINAKSYVILWLWLYFGRMRRFLEDPWQQARRQWIGSTNYKDLARKQKVFCQGMKFSCLCEAAGVPTFLNSFPWLQLVTHLHFSCQVTEMALETTSPEDWWKPERKFQMPAHKWTPDESYHCPNNLVPTCLDIKERKEGRNKGA